MDAPPVQYVTTSDGYRIAYCVSGEGLPLVLLPLPLHSIQRLWESQRTALWMEGLSARFRLVQYDVRTQGASTARAGADLSIEAHGRDLKAVVDRLQIERCILLAWSGLGHVAVRYALANPDRVAALILVCCPVSGASFSHGMFETLVGEDWEVFIRTQIPPGLTLEERTRELDLLRRSVTQEAAVAGMRGALGSNLEDALPLLRVPTLVMHPRDFLTLRPQESMKLAASIANARMVLTDGSDTFGDAGQSLAAIDAFLKDSLIGAGHGQPSPNDGSANAGLSQRELEVLRLVAAGRSNQQIADELVISLNRVRRHVSNIFAKIGVENRAQAAVYARDHGIG
jgi:pimeloyl-ACP methyl ester carboxylesterase